MLANKENTSNELIRGRSKELRSAFYCGASLKLSQICVNIATSSSREKFRINLCSQGGSKELGGNPELKSAQIATLQTGKSLYSNKEL